MRNWKTLLQRRSTSFWLVLIFAAAACLRFTGINWDRGHYLHPDERFLVMTAEKLSWPQPATLYFDEARSPLNPRNSGQTFFAYGTLPLTTLKAVSLLTGATGMEALTITGRGLSALFDLLTVLLVFDLALALALGRRTALYAAAFYAASVCAIQHAHFFVVDPAANYFLAAALVSIAHYRRAGRAWDALWAGLCLGLALACKVTAALLFPVALMVFLDRARGAGRPVWWRLQGLIRQACVFALFTVVALAVFRVAEPTAFRGPELWRLTPSDRWLANLAESSRYATGTADIPPGHQWAGRTPLWFPWSNLVIWGMGLALGLAAWTGWLLAAIRAGQGRARLLLLPVLWTGLLFTYHGTQWAMTMRYFLPIYGSLCVLAAWVLVRRAPRVAPVVAGLTFAWAAAFALIYVEPHTRIQTSEWIYRNIPAGRSISYEYWDDALPLDLAGRSHTAYRSVQMSWFDEDSPEKLRRALEWLDATEYIVLNSNRLSAPIPRLPARFPMAARYYRALSDGALGFAPAARFSTWMGDHGEEAFSVFDHPVVRIFRKTPGYSHARAATLLGAVEWHNVVTIDARSAGAAPTGLMLPPERRHVAGAVPRYARFPLVAWMLAIFVLGWLVAPLVGAACPGFPDRGYGLAKTLGLLLAGWLVWLVASTGVGRFTPLWIWICAAVLACAWIGHREYISFVKENWRLLLVVDLVFLAAFALMGALRMGNPDLWHPGRGGEKPMDFAYLNAILRTDHFPPQNPWFSGGYINYYYFGFVPLAALMKGCGIQPETGWNLALATLFALVAAGLYSVTAALLPPQRRKWAVLGPLFVLILGNLKQVSVLFAWFHGSTLPYGEGYFSASRAIGAPPGAVPPITEFPYFTYLFGDLHAHAMALPIGVLALGLLVSLSNGVRRTALALVALCCGALWASNPWDLPMMALLLAAALWFTRPGVRAVLLCAGVLILARLAFFPYHHWFASGYGQFDWWNGPRTSVRDYFVVYGVFLLAIALGRIRRFAAVIAAAGFLLTVAVELIVLRGDIARMNTSFKFGFQAWLLLGLAAAVAAGSLERARLRQGIVAVAAATALAYPLSAPLFRLRDRFVQISPTWNGMEYMTAARHSQCGHEFPLAEDRQAIDWLRAHVPGTPVIAEANTYPVLYGWGSRISSHTGLPTIVGWDWHLRQQMGVQNAGRVERRIADVQEIYSTPNASRADELLRRYGAEYVVVGRLERACTPEPGIGKFQTGAGRYWNTVFERGATRIYRLAGY